MQPLGDSSAFIAALQPVKYTVPGQTKMQAGFTVASVQAANAAAGWDADFALITDPKTGAVSVNPFAILAPIVQVLQSSSTDAVSSLVNMFQAVTAFQDPAVVPDASSSDASQPTDPSQSADASAPQPTDPSVASAPSSSAAPQSVAQPTPAVTGSS